MTSVRKKILSFQNIILYDLICSINALTYYSQTVLSFDLACFYILFFYISEVFSVFSVECSVHVL